MRDKPKAWYLGWAGALISQEREYKALHEVKNMKVRCFHTSRQHATAQAWKHAEQQSVNCQPATTHTHTTYDLASTGSMSCYCAFSKPASSCTDSNIEQSRIATFPSGQYDVTEGSYMSSYTGQDV